MKTRLTGFCCKIHEPFHFVLPLLACFYCLVGLMLFNEHWSPCFCRLQLPVYMKQTKGRRWDDVRVLAGGGVPSKPVCHLTHHRLSPTALPSSRAGFSICSPPTVYATEDKVEKWSYSTWSTAAVTGCLWQTIHRQAECCWPAVPAILGLIRSLFKSRQLICLAANLFIVRLVDSETRSSCRFLLARNDTGFLDFIGKPRIVGVILYWVPRELQIYKVRLAEQLAIPFARLGVRSLCRVFIRSTF